MTTKNEDDLLDELVRFSQKLGLIEGQFKEMAEGIRKTFSGFRGLIYTHDETATVWGCWERPKKFTPKQFNQLWESFSEKRKVEYVLSLIT